MLLGRGFLYGKVIGCAWDALTDWNSGKETMAVVDIYASEKETIEQSNRISDMLSLCRQSVEDDPYRVYHGVKSLSDTNACKFFCMEDFKTINQIMNENPMVIRMWNSRPTLEALYHIASDRGMKRSIRMYMKELGLLNSDFAKDEPPQVIAMES